MADALIPMPEEIEYYNSGSVRCDMVAGPCACGAWHDVKEWDRRTIDGKPVSGHWSFQAAVKKEAKP